jgi:hypothetical protein
MLTQAVLFAHQVDKARIGSNAIKEVHAQHCHPEVALFVTFLQPRDRFFLLAQSVIVSLL